MKLATEDREIERVSTSTERRFTIKANGRAFRILSSGLYKDKILAIVRELSCNAYDAHVSIGKGDVPFIVHLPNALENFFSVRDFGPGLSDHHMNTIYSTYFESTKTDNNDQIGGLGLGCKSPLSYVDSFTLVSRHEGEKRTYTVFFDETDTPTITEMGRAEKTDEPSGLEVKIPTKQHDSYQFREKAQTIFQNFPCCPTVIGNADFKIKERKSILVGDGYKLYEESHTSAKALMGIVAYPIHNPSVTGLTGIHAELVNSPIIIDFKIGDLDITAGREELSYIPMTQKRIRERLDEVTVDMTRRIIKMFRACKTEYEAKKLYGEVIYSRFGSKLFPKGKIPFKNKFVESSMFDIVFQDLKGLELTNFTMASYTGMRKVHHDHGTVRLHASEELRIFRDDLEGRTTQSRIRQFYADHGMSFNVTVIKGPQEAIDKVRTILDGVDIIDISTLPKAPPTPRKAVSFLQLEDTIIRGGHQVVRDSWNRVSVDPAQGGLYVPMCSGAIYQAPNVPAVNFSETFRTLHKLGLIDVTQPIYAIPKSLMKSIEGEDGWVNFFEEMEKKFKAKMATENWEAEIGKNNAWKSMQSKYSNITGEQMFLKRIAEKLPQNHSLGDFLDLLQTYAKTNDFADQRLIGEKFGIQVAGAAESDFLTNEWERIGSKYKMLNYLFQVGQWHRVESKSIADAVEYILLADSTNGNCKSIA
jgi:hypothetical protein